MLDQVTDFLSRHFGGIDIPPHAPLALLNLDSLDLLDALYHLEKEFAVNLDDLDPAGLSAAVLAMEITQRTEDSWRPSCERHAS